MTALSPTIRLLVAGLGTLVVTATVAPRVHAQDVQFLFGSAFGYASDDFCLDSEAFVDSYHASVDGSLVGFQASYNNVYPWPPDRPPGSGGGGGAARQGNFFSQGHALAASVKAYPLGFARRFGAEGLAEADRYVRPYVAVGIQRTTDGETAPAGEVGDLPVFAVGGQTSPIVAFGASVLLPGRGSRFGVIVDYRRSIRFAGDYDIETDAGQMLTVEGARRGWSEINVGFRVGL